MTPEARIAEVLAQHMLDEDGNCTGYAFNGSGTGCDWQVDNSLRNSWERQHVIHLAAVITTLPDIAIVALPGDVAPCSDDSTWFNVRGYEYYGGTDEDMPVDQVEAQAADNLAIARYRRDAVARAAGGES